MVKKSAAASVKTPARKPARKAAPRGAAKSGFTLQIGTRKGAFLLRSDATRKRWTLDGPMHFGATVNHLVADPRSPKLWIAGVRTGHLGPTVQRSLDAGKTWIEAKQPPAFSPAPEGTKGRTVENVFWITPGHASEPNVWWAGSVPHGLFRSDDGGERWREVESFTKYLATLDPTKIQSPPGGGMTHSILIDPRDKNHMFVSLSSGGTFESKDGSATWAPFNRGVALDFYPGQELEIGHDPHCMIQCPADAKRLYQQNHCGIYRLDMPGTQWVRIGKNMPAAIGDIGFPILSHPRNADVVWVIPMDGTTVWPRTSIEGKPAVFMSKNAGGTWQRMTKGLPAKNAWHTVYRQSFACDGADPVGLYFGTSSGEMWASRDEGKSWKKIYDGLPAIIAVECCRG